MTVIADSTPLIALSGIGRLAVLRELYGHVIIPQSVFREVVDAGQNRPGMNEVSSASWISVRVVPSPRAEVVSSGTLDEGELDAIILALSEPEPLLIIDELAGRREAQRRGLNVIGTIGILEQAKAH